MNQIYYEYYYFKFIDQLVRGVRLYQSDDEWYAHHPGMTYAKKVPVLI